jgi:galactose mutarotase-like enzyme
MSTAALAEPSVAGETIEGFAAVTLRAGELSASFMPTLGMVGASLRHAGEELLDRRAGLRAYRDTGAVMGLPLLHPWANRLDAFSYTWHGRHVVLPDGPPLVRCEEHGLPIHGLLAAHPGWSARTEADAERARLRARLDVRAFPDVLAAFPFPHSLTIDAVLTAQRLTLTTTVRPNGGAPVPIAFGHHPYFTLPGAPRERWRVSLPARRHLALDARGLPTGAATPEAPARFALRDRAFDDGYDGIAAGAAFAVEGGGRRVTVTHDAGYPIAQIYSPAGAPFICFEPMTAPVNALRTGAGLRRVIPGDRFAATFSIAVDAL